jgi:predicted RNase H-like HicB family nuclease
MMVAVSEIPTRNLNHRVITFTPGRTYECKIAIIQEDDGGFSAHATDLPGAVGQGESVEEATQSVAEALQGVLASYKAAGRIPWTKIVIHDEVICEKRILVNV